ncbi:cyclase [Aeromicrobium sp. Root495]|uniref:SRPBCC family protein n=1 Tax=Aeromicrobium sp. Root495 TaxID=1736550 RepID=UPI0006FC778A|nr:SRPBCC family protein [Aeromicrobium sp. Root495]KQY60036.1 cyclase [Aeromicrobium sp. Root495]RYJ06794.1 MAG: SRPBCC family protein [Actinomycetales bacterium]
MKDSVTLHMDATPQQVWDVVSDITRTGEWSPETFEARWTRGSTGPELGAWFKGHVRRSGKGPVVYWSLCQVTACEPGREFGFTVLGPGGRRINNWHYLVEPAADGGADVTESFRMEPSAATRVYWLLAGWLRGRYNRRNMTASLERIASIVTAPH